MKFSVLIPVYNVEAFLDQCVASVMAQSHSDFEILLVDDGSTDMSPQKCDDYQRRYPETIRVFHSENKGLISARRIGIANAAGDYCVFVDSDDYVRKDLLKTLNRHLEEDQSIDILLYSYSYMTDGKRVKDHPRIADDGTIWEEDGKKELYEKLAFTNEITPIWIKACRTALLQSDPTDYSVYYRKNMAEDVLQSLYPVTYAKRIKYISDPLYCYRYNGQSISRNYTPDSFQRMDTTHVYHKVKEYLPMWGMDKEEYVSRLNARWFDLAMYFFRKCYTNAKSRRDKRVVMDYDWNAMIPCHDIRSYAENVNQSNLKIYRWYSEKKMLRLDAYFFKNQLYGSYKSLKHAAHNR